MNRHEELIEFFKPRTDELGGKYQNLDFATLREWSHGYTPLIADDNNFNTAIHRSRRYHPEEFMKGEHRLWAYMQFEVVDCKYEVQFEIDDETQKKKLLVSLVKMIHWASGWRLNSIFKKKFLDKYSWETERFY